jgi:hypothetical protein
MWFAKGPCTSKEVPDGDGVWAGPAPAADHLRCVRGRIHAELFQQGVAVPEGAIGTAATRSMLADGDLALSPAGRQRITVGYRMIDATDTEALPLKKQLQRFGARQLACRALADAQYGIGGLIAVAVWS